MILKNANTYLNQLRLLNVQIQQKEKELVRLREDAESITAKAAFFHRQYRSA